MSSTEQLTIVTGQHGSAYSQCKNDSVGNIQAHERARNHSGPVCFESQVAIGSLDSDGFLSVWNVRIHL